MADMMQFDLVSPERSLASFQVSEVQIPGADGDLTAMPGHAPTITTLRPGLLKVVAGSETHEYLVTGGFAEITAAGVSVLAEMSLPRAEVTRGHVDKLIEDAQEAHKSAGEETVDAAAKLLADMVAIGDHIGLS
ncbi:F0F1 ATP synthase subunit epsilon [Pseudogemmobacter sp. W21_MBD1_M6]|jgi:F-type H+-transporting ATPase subunit epsilon|uniref:F0F1 ATP synthase subunit epsilon n=1 Tax=Pseudogemmobacter sp. W21_MBD1_M6 TaxID=3240271 RepID=UPI003F9D5669